MVMRAVGEVGKPVDPASHLGCHGQEEWRRAKITEDNTARLGGRGGNWRGRAWSRSRPRVAPRRGQAEESVESESRGRGTHREESRRMGKPVDPARQLGGKRRGRYQVRWVAMPKKGRRRCSSAHGPGPRQAGDWGDVGPSTATRGVAWRGSKPCRAGCIGVQRTAHRARQYSVPPRPQRPGRRPPACGTAVAAEGPPTASA